MELEQKKIPFIIRRPLPNGSSFYTPTVSLDLSKVLDIKEEDHKIFSDFVDWIKNYNDYIYKEWSDKNLAKQEQMSDDDIDTVDQFIDVEMDKDN